MIKLLKFLADTLEPEQQYQLAMFLSDNPDVIDKETMVQIISTVEEMRPEKIRKDLDELEELFKKHDRESDTRILKNMLNDFNINLN